MKIRIPQWLKIGTSITLYKTKDQQRKETMKEIDRAIKEQRQKK